MRAQLALLALLGGCNSPFGLGGQDLEGNDQQEVASAETDVSEPILEGPVEASCPDTGGEMERALSATGGEGTLAITDSGVSAQCCAEFRVEMVVSEPLRLEISYVDDAAEPCDCMCGWYLGYTISALDPGDWTIVADGAEASATVR